jgi:SWI/SNF-related matrix-associated actin-dependent regulator of chromatin subfamily A member 5
MNRRSLHLQPPSSATPPAQRQGGHLQSLLAQFGSRASADSATKTRRASSQHAPDASPALPAFSPTSPAPAAVSPAVSATPASKETAPPRLPSADLVASSTPADSQPQPSSPATPPAELSSEDELAHSVRPVRKRGFKAANDAAHSAVYNDLKMEYTKSRSATGPRRSARKSNIIESDTLVQLPTPTRRAPAPRLDTARARLRDEITHQSKFKADNFLVANKDCFLPLLPANNYVSKLVANHSAQPVVEYKQLEQQPDGVVATMKPYQLSGLSYLVYLYNNGFSGILGDEMGLGKTLQTLSLFQYLEELDRKNNFTSEELRPYLVVCPLSVLNSWVAEARRWVPELKVLRIHGAKSERDRLKRVALGMEDLQGNETVQNKNRKASRKAGIKTSTYKDQGDSSYKIIVTTYDTFHAEESWFKHSFVWRYVVLDEGHKIKSSTTNISSSLKNISSEFRLILTGTPLQNNLLEMWALLTWLYPDVFSSKTELLFRESFDLSKGKVNRQTMDDARRLLELIMLRRMKDSPSVNLGLPPKTEVLLYVPLTPMQRFWYTRLLTRVDNSVLNDVFANGKEKEKASLEQDKQDDQLLQQVAKLDNPDTVPTGEWGEMAQIMRQAIKKEETASTNKSAWQKLMNLVMQLRKCCSHPYLLPDVAPDPYYLGDHIIRASGKFILLEKLLKHTVLKEGKKVLIFSGFSRTLDCCEDLLSLVSNFGEHFRHLRLDGSTARAIRNLDIRLFNQNPEYKVMLLSTRAGGLGINLTSAQDVIFLDEDWNPQITLQAEARAHRIGQTKPVTIYKLCTQGTVEEQMMGRIRKKLYLSAKITESMRNIHGDEAPAQDTTTDDMPQMDTTQLKTLIRRGAQTLSHPDIDVTEMISWDLETMLAKCRDKGVNASEVPDEEADEEKWLSAMERVECAIFDGKRYQRQLDNEAKAAAKNILPDTISRQDRRKGKNTTVMYKGYAISKESMGCGDWEAVPTLAGKDPRLAEPIRNKRREIIHEEHCLVCFNGTDSGDMITCKTCPRAYHHDCLEPEYQAKVRGISGFHCPQHKCDNCTKSTTDAGGLIYRCRWCPHGFCEDCLDWDKVQLIGKNLPEFELLGEEPPSGGFYIKCPDCIEACADSTEHMEWTKGRETEYKKQHTIMLQQRTEARRELDKQITDTKGKPEVLEIANPPEDSFFKPKGETTKQHVVRTNQALSPTPSKSPSTASLRSVQPNPIIVLSDSDSDKTFESDKASEPSSADTSLPTPALGASRVSTPKSADARKSNGTTRRKRESTDVRGAQKKKARRSAA